MDPVSGGTPGSVDPVSGGNLPSAGFDNVVTIKMIRLVSDNAPNCQRINPAPSTPTTTMLPGAVFCGPAVVCRKTFHRYVVRAKQGGRQSAKDASGSAPQVDGMNTPRCFVLPAGGVAAAVDRRAGTQKQP